MICYIVLAKNSFPTKKRRVTAKKKGPTLSDLGFLAVAAAAVPASGFITDNSGLVPPTTGAVNQTPVGSGMRTFFAACAWAFMLAAGSMVYQHFLGKWEGSGLPILPIAALGTMTGNPSMPNHARSSPLGFPPSQQHQQPQQGPAGYGIPLGAPPPHYPSQPQGVPSQQRSVLDRYPC